MKKITQERLKEVFDYVDGNFVCKIARSFLKVGDIVGSKTNHGYITICIDKEKYLMHRLVFLYFNGFIPKEVDHINGNRCDNRIENLREVTHTQNQWNYPMQKKNKSGFKGVDMCKKTGKWRAQIRQDSKKKHIGLFATPELAHEAYCNAALNFQKEFARFN